MVASKNIPNSESTILPNNTVVDFAKGYLAMSKAADQREKDYALYEEMLENRELNNSRYDNKIRRFELEHPSVSVKYAVVGEQASVDELVESIKEGNISSYLDILDKCDHLGMQIPDDILPKKPITTDELEVLSPSQRLDLEIAVEDQLFSKSTPEAIEEIKKQFHITEIDNFSDKDIFLIGLRQYNKSRAETFSLAYGAIPTVFGENEDKVIEAALGADTEDPFVIGDKKLKESWRNLLDGPNGVLEKCFIFNQHDPRLPLQVSGTKTITHAIIYS